MAHPFTTRTTHRAPHPSPLLRWWESRIARAFALSSQTKIHPKTIIRRVGRPTNNQLSTSSYVVAGNTIYDTYNTYYYYPEGDLCAVQPNLTGSSLTMYVYDAAGTRVAKGTPVWTGSGSPNMSTLCSAPGGGTGWSFSAEEQYLLDKNNEQVSELTGTSTPTPERTNIWSGTNIATYDFVNGGVHFALTDWLGTKRVQVLGTGTNYGTIELSFISLPYGNNIGNSRAVESIGSGTDATEHHFTGKERDTESGLDYFGARYYASSMGRWLSPDPKIISKQRMFDPQQWNMYGYAKNNPLIAIDPDGREVKLLNEGALQRIQSTLPASVRSQVTAGRNGMLDQKAIAGIKSNDPNVKALQTLVASPKVVEFGTGKSAGGYDFSYQSKEAAQAQIKAAGGDPSVQTGPNLYLGLTTPASKSPDGNTQVMVSNGTGDASTAPEAELAATAAHELYGHALDEVQGQPYEHEVNPDGTYDPNGAVNKQTQQIEDHTKELQKQP